MKRLFLCFLLLYIDNAYSNPYFYRESKHQSEHHKEYSYDGQGGPQPGVAGSESFGGHQEIGVKETAPLRYYKVSSVPVYSGAIVRSQGGGYSSSGQGLSLFGSGLQQQQISLPPVTHQKVIYTSSSPVVVKHSRIVKYYGQPGATTQTRYYSSGGSGILESGHKEYIDPQSLLEEAGKLLGKDFQQGHSQVVKKTSTFYGQERPRYGFYDPNREVEQLGQKEVKLSENDRNLQLGQKEESSYGNHERRTLVYGQREEAIHHSGGRTATFDLGQQEVPIGSGFHTGSLEIGQKEEAIHHSGGQTETFDLGQQEVPIGSGFQTGSLIIGQKEETIHHSGGQTIDLGQREEPIGPGFQVGNLEIGQKEESLYHRGDQTEIGQEEEPINSVIQKEILQIGQKEKGRGDLTEIFDLGQKEVPISPAIQTGRMEIGQKEESLYPSGGQTETFHLGQQEVPISSGFHTGSFEIGQKEETIHHSVGPTIDLGQREEPIGPGFHTGSLEIGQKEESLYPSGGQTETFHLGQQEVPISSGFHTGSLEIGQKEETIHHSVGQTIDLGQREESIGPGFQTGNLEIGQKEESLYPSGGQTETFHLGQQEVPISSGFQTGSLVIGQKEEAIHHSGGQTFDLGQREEPIGPGFQTGNLEIGQKEESLYHRGDQTEIGPDEEPINSVIQKQILQIGQKEKGRGDLTETFDLGQKEVPIISAIQTGRLEIGQKEESLYPSGGQTEIFDLGQKEVPISSAIQTGRLEIGQKEESLYPSGGPSSHFDLGQKEEPIGLGIQTGRLEIGQKEKTLYPGGGYLEQKVGPNKPIIVKKNITTIRKESFFQQHSSEPLQVGQKEVSLYQQHNRPSEGQTQQSLYGTFKSEPLKEEGQKEESLYGHHKGPLESGQREESLYGGFSQVGRIPTNTELELGQREELGSQIEHIDSNPAKLQVIPNKDSTYHTKFITTGSHLEVGQQGKDALAKQLDDLLQQALKEMKSQQGSRPGKGVKTVYYSIQHPGTSYQSGNNQGYGYQTHRSTATYDQTGATYNSGGSLINNDHGRYPNIHGGHNSNYGGRSYIGATGGHGYKETTGVGIIDERLDENTKSVPKETQASSTGGSIHSIQAIRTEGEKRENIDTVQSANRQPSGVFKSLDQKVEDLALQLGLDEFGKQAGQTTTSNQGLITGSAQGGSSNVHNAEIFEMGLENVGGTSGRVPVVEEPIKKVNIYEMHREEHGMDYPTKKTYSKKSSRYYSASHGVSSVVQPNIDEQLERLQSGSQNSRGSLYRFSRHKYSGSDHSGERLARSPADRHKDIDEFLTELDKDIARTSGKTGQSGYVQVTQNQRSPASSSSSYSHRTVTSHSRVSSGPTVTTERKWYQKVGDSISSTYGQAKDKVKDIVSSAKTKIGY